MSLDNLLLWLSATGRGSWPQFRSAVERLHIEAPNDSLDYDDGQLQESRGSDLPLYQHARYAMERLAHVEFFSSERETGWRVVPPTIALQGEHALLCGARSPEILNGLRNSPEFDVSISTSRGGPSRICLLGATPRIIAERARAHGFHVQDTNSLTILACLPAARDVRSWAPFPIPATSGWTVHRFSASRLQWTEDSQAKAAKVTRGLFRFQLGFQRIYFLRWRKRTYRVNVQVGKYAIMRRRAGLLQYDGHDRTFSVPMICRPPPLIERALVLCSGQLPAVNLETRRLNYSNIPSQVVRTASQLLGQEAR